jgi:hypothetical protein
VRLGLVASISGDPPVLCPSRCGDIENFPDFIGGSARRRSIIPGSDRLTLKARGPLEAIAEVGDRQLVPQTQHPLVDPLTVDPGAIGASQVADQDPVRFRSQAAVAPRDPGRGDPGVAPEVPAHHNHDTVEGDVGMTVQ